MTDARVIEIADYREDEGWMWLDWEAVEEITRKKDETMRMLHKNASFTAWLHRTSKGRA